MAGFILHNYTNNFGNLRRTKSLTTVSKSSTKMSASMLRSARLLSYPGPLSSLGMLWYILICWTIFHRMLQISYDTPLQGKFVASHGGWQKPSPHFAMNERSSGACRFRYSVLEEELQILHFLTNRRWWNVVIILLNREYLKCTHYCLYISFTILSHWNWSI